MNKKFLLLGAAFAMANVSSEARVSGFYVGASGSASVAQFKIYDASSHSGVITDVTVTAGDGGAKVRTTGLIRGNKSLEGPMRDVRNFSISKGKVSTSSLVIPSILTSNEENTAEEGIFKFRPAARIFVGYNYQIGSSFVVGLELSGGMTFGAHKYEGVIDIPDLKNFEKAKDAEGFVTGIKEVTPFDDKTTRTTFEVKTKFDGDASLRLGYLIPGTDGRLALFLRGGVGLMNREIKATQASLDPYLLALSNSHHAASDSAVRIVHESQTVDAETDDAASQKMVPLGYVLNVGNLFTGASGRLNTNNQYMTLGGPFDAKDEAAREGAAVSILSDILGAAKSKDSLYFKDLSAAPSLSKSATKFTWHAGVDAEYHFASGLFVRASYTFKYAKGFFAEAFTNITLLPDTKAKDVIESYFSAGDESSLFGARILAAVDSNKVSVVTTLAGWPGLGAELAKYSIAPASPVNLTTDAKRLLLASVKKCWQDIPNELSNVSLGSLNSKLGLGNKSFYHDFSLGIGFKFLG